MNNHFDFRLCHLQRLRWIGRNRIKHWLKTDPYLKNIYRLSIQDLQAKLFLSPNKAQDVYIDLHSNKIKESIEQDLEEFRVLTIFNDDYPKLLKTIPDPPLLLYTSGNTSLLKVEPKLSVIGARNFSIEAKRKVFYLLQPLVKNHWMIVSGLARGIDTMAHEAAMHFNGKTIAVLGFGFHHIYPKENKDIMRAIADHHLLISEYPPHTPPQKWHFPERNRIISGLSFGSLIMEAMERSGTFITAGQALEQGRDVFVVPGSIFSPQSSGCHLLIKEGAELVQHGNDLLEAWELRKNHWII